ncbi:MAG: hypothetical protein CVU84_09745 [Firmicutes bacterium HGW-Firmicutes-1]|jgi:hypothetical protein|nr:MAG: hypothetical protein CVU84_09745 [Firmicutes bacterium HGW-Firmicutes-1]
MLKYLLINGSPRKTGTSYSFARTIKMLIEKEGNNAEIIHVYDYFDGKESIHNLKTIIPEYDTLALIAPLYVDTLPYPDIWFLEEMLKDCKDELNTKGLFAIGQCGFPDITRCEPLLDVCKFFAEETKMNWLGGLAYGGGAILNGALLENLGKKGETITAAFKCALDSIHQNKPISQKAQALITLKIPKLLYRPLAVFLNNNARKTAKKNGICLERKFYLE